MGNYTHSSGLGRASFPNPRLQSSADLSGVPRVSPSQGKLSDSPAGSRYSRILESTTKVTGPSLTKETDIMAANLPVATGRPSAIAA